MNDSMPPGIRGASEEHPDMLKTGMSVLRLAGGCIGLFSILMGVTLAYGVFTTVRNMVVEPDTLSGFLDEWEINMAEKANPLAVPEPETQPTDMAVAAEAPPADAAPKPETEPAATTTPKGQSTLKPPFHAPVPRHAEFPQLEDMDDLKEILRTIRSGTFARPLGAFFMLLLVAILARIPIALMVTGARILGLTGMTKPGKPTSIGS